MGKTLTLRRNISSPTSLRAATLSSGSIRLQAALTGEGSMELPASQSRTTAVLRTKILTTLTHSRSVMELRGGAMCLGIRWITVATNITAAEGYDAFYQLLWLCFSL